MSLKIKCGAGLIISKDGVRFPLLFKLDNSELHLTFHPEPDIHFAYRF